MSGEMSRVACFTGLTDIVNIGDVSVHIQTEYLKDKTLLITIVNRSGRCIHRAERNCSKHVEKPDFYIKLAQVAQAQQRSIVQRIQEIWAEYLKKQSIRPPTNGPSNPIAERVSYLLDLGFKIYQIATIDESVSMETAKDSAKITWLEALELDPENRMLNACLSNLDNGVQIAQRIRRLHRIRQARERLNSTLQCKT